MTRRLILAIDSTCTTCRRLGRAVGEAGGARLEVLSLHDENVRRYRAEVYGDAAPWAPTLLEVDAAGVSGWAGKRLVAPLVRRLGARRTWSVLRAVGELHAEARAAGADVAPGRAGISRHQFVYGMTGAFVGLSMLSTGRAFAATPSAVARVQTLTGDATALRMSEVLARPDVRSVVDPETLYKLQLAKPAGAADVPENMHVVRYGRGGSTAVSDTCTADGQCAVFGGSDVDLVDGNRMHTGALVMPERNTLLISRTYDRPHLDVSRSAELWQLPDDGSSEMRLMSISVNGAAPRVLAAAEVCDECAPRTDGRTPTRTDSYCSASNGYNCLRASSACAGCVGACLGPKAGCYICAVATCPFVFTECCNQTNIYCLACGGDG